MEVEVSYLLAACTWLPACLRRGWPHRGGCFCEIYRRAAGTYLEYIAPSAGGILLRLLPAGVSMFPEHMRVQCMVAAGYLRITWADSCLVVGAQLPARPPEKAIRFLDADLAGPVWMQAPPGGGGGGGGIMY